MVPVIVADDYDLMREQLCKTIHLIDGYTVVAKATNGKVLLDCLQQQKSKVEIAIIDVKMPKMDGIAVTHFLQTEMPAIKVVGISFSNDPIFFTSMLDAGAKGYLLKNSLNTDYLTKAFTSIAKGEVYIDPYFADEYRIYIDAQKNKQNIVHEPPIPFSNNEIKYLQLIACDLDYVEISGIMHKSPRTIQKYQDSVKTKTGISSRIGQAMFAVSNSIAKIMRKS